MKPKIMMLLLIIEITLCTFVSCGPGLDEEGSTNHLYIENNTNETLEIVYIQLSSNTEKQFNIELNEEVNVFTVSSGLGYDETNDPSCFDIVYVRYSDKVLIDSVKGKYLLDFYSFKEKPEATYKKKYETHYKRIFTINQDYIDKHTSK